MRSLFVHPFSRVAARAVFALAPHALMEQHHVSDGTRLERTY
jgi:hypothetical protein